MLKAFKNCSLYQQLILPMLVVGLIGMLGILVSAMMLEKSVNALGDLFTSGSERLKTLQDIDKNLAEYRALSLRHLASEDAQKMAEIKVDADLVKKRITAALATVRKHDIPQYNANQSDLVAMQTSLGQYFSDIGTSIQLSADFEKESAFEQLTTSENIHLARIHHSMRQLTRHAFDDISASKDDLTQATSRNLAITLMVGILGGVLLLLIAFHVTRRASGRLNSLLTWSGHIAEGNLDVVLKADSHDEIGRLTGAMASMVEKLALNRSVLEQARREAETTAESLRLYANAFDSSGEAMLITDHDNRIINVNSAFVVLTGYSLDEIQGQNPKLLSSGKSTPETFQTMWYSLQTRNFWEGELWDRRKSGEIYPKWCSISTIRDAQQNVMFYIASFTDISERKANEARIDFLAHHDALTGLINRFNLEIRLSQTLLAAHRNNRLTAIMFIDMDRFKSINDTLGHHVGDQLLIEVAHRLTESVRESDIVARLGGDEFVVAITQLNDAIEAAPVADKILRALGQPYRIDGHELHSSPSIGIAIAPHDGEDGETLMKNADVAMYHAKERGRNNAQFFTAALNNAASERMVLENDLRQALKHGELHLHYQPQRCVAQDRPCGVEALARWTHPTKGMIPPDKFIPIAEESDLIETLGAWVLDEACRQLRAWFDAGLTDVRMAINLSAQQLRSPDLIQRITGLLHQYGLKGHDLELEITESVAMENPERAIQQLQALRELGIQLAIDDFGTGYSSLAYLKRLPIQVLKLDRSFVRDLETNQSDAEICAATLALAHNLGLKVVAEGVETPGQQDFLISHRCDLLQGYLFSQPLPADQALAYLKSA